jgi:two-component system alkaline phosphatase synthesis response regulator PhoP
MIKKILVVEDEEDIVGLLCAIFSDFVNYETLYVTDGQQALNIARVNNPDIILLDIQLLELTGYEVCRLVKSDPALSHTKVLMLSGMTQDSDWLKAQEAGADDFIAKPFSSIALLEKVEELLRSNEGS